MAEALLNRNCAEASVAESARLEPGNLNLIVVEVWRERGIDIAGKGTRSVDEALRSGISSEYVITVCEEGSAAGCPVVSRAQRLHWSFSDPSLLHGSHAERLAGTRAVCDQIQQRIEEWCPTFA